VLFADIVGFTRLNERLSPERTFALLRSFRERSTAVVFRHQGTLDKYLVAARASPLILAACKMTL
jgi:adenylate cyclase